MPRTSRVEVIVKTDPRGDIQEFQHLLDTKADERRVHEFLANHSYFFNRLLRLDGKSPLY